MRALGALAVLVGLSGLFAREVANSTSWQLLRHARTVPSPTHVFLGNSTVAAAIDEAAVAGAAPGARPVNMGIGATFPTEHYLLLRQVTPAAGAVIVYGFMETNLTSPVDGSFSALVGNRSLVFDLEPAVAADLLVPDSAIKRAWFQVIARIPLAAHRSSLWAHVETWRRVLGGIGLPAAATNRFGRVNDFAALAPDPAEFASRCRAVAAVHAPLTRGIREILNRATQQRSAVFIVSMPMPSAHRARLYDTDAWHAYTAYVATEVRAAGATFLDASAWMPDSAFSDPLHLGTQGAREFSQRLTRELSALR